MLFGSRRGEGPSGGFGLPGWLEGGLKRVSEELAGRLKDGLWQAAFGRKGLKRQGSFFVASLLFPHTYQSFMFQVILNLYKPGVSSSVRTLTNLPDS